MTRHFTDTLLSENDKMLFQSWQYSDNVPSAHAIRARVILSLNEGKSITETARSFCFSRRTVHKWLNRYISGDPDWYKGRSRRPHHMPLMLSESKERDIISEVNTLIYSNRKPSVRCIQSEFLKYQIRSPSKTTIHRVINEARVKGLLLQPTNRYNLNSHSQQTLNAIARNRSTPSCLAKRAKMVLLSAEGNSTIYIARYLKSSVVIVERWLRQYDQHGVEGLYSKKPVKNRKDQDESIKSQVFGLLHSPPIEHNINRTSWRMSDLKNCLGKRGLAISEAVIRRVVKSGGYQWRKAQKVLTSPDPDYRHKLDKVKKVLSALRSNDRFFFIDEFGPCAIRKYGGKKLVAPGEDYFIPQYQRSKGRLIITAALEMSTNQVTHFYSKRKDTVEIIKLIEVLIKEYSDCETLYLSWDAASWHESKMLRQFIDKHNQETTIVKRGPKVLVVPLPKSAQFLNVIESIFSGLAKAVIHNSNYDTEESAKQAIDRYFQERNLHYQIHPRRAGKKMWGQELVAVEFNEGQNCKDPKWSRIKLVRKYS